MMVWHNGGGDLMDISLRIEDEKFPWTLNMREDWGQRREIVRRLERKGRRKQRIFSVPLALLMQEVIDEIPGETRNPFSPSLLVLEALECLVPIFVELNLESQT